MGKKPSTFVQLNVRVPKALRKLLVAQARRNKRSLNREVQFLLEQSFTSLRFDDIKEEIKKLIERHDHNGG